MSLLDLFDLSLLGCSSETALEFRDHECTFGQLESASNRLARHLADTGLREGDRLAVYLANSVELVEAYLAAIKLGLIFTPINILFRAQDAGHILSHSEPRMVLTTRDLLEHLPPQTPSATIEDIYPRLARLPDTRPPCPAEGGSPAALFYTSGSTGRPKGALLTHDNLAINTITLNTCWRMERGDRALHALPLAHLNGLANGLHPWLTMGFRLRLLDRFRKETILDEFLDFRPTFFLGVPTVYERLLQANQDQARRIGRDVRLFVSGSAPLSAAAFEKFRAIFGRDILERYGMTETLGNLSNPYAAERRPGTVGKPLPGVSIRLSGGAEGEVLVKGPCVFAGYWRDEAATRAAFTSDGYFRTGDLARRSADGYYTLAGRRDDLILSGGFNIYPAEIEHFLCRQPGVRAAVVVGAADSTLGAVPIAFIELEADAEFDPQALDRACRASFASYKAPREYRKIQETPRNALGKIQRHKLKQLVATSD